MKGSRVCLTFVNFLLAHIFFPQVPVRPSMYCTQKCENSIEYCTPKGQNSKSIDSLFIDAPIVLVFFVFIPPAYFVCGGYTVFTLSVPPSVRPCMRPSVTLCFLNILKSHCWIFIKHCKHVHIFNTNTFSKKVRARGQFYKSYFPFYTPPQTLFVAGILFSRCPCVRLSVRASVRP